ncbi:hypothetical protein BDZ89DRAFT_1129591 [Hymenopellis radicata]|nr:hypothetical protein BDZ89DRAFT_1129591 [Hymenopellis radicata]
MAMNSEPTLADSDTCSVLEVEYGVTIISLKHDDKKQELDQIWICIEKCYSHQFRPSLSFAPIWSTKALPEVDEDELDVDSGVEPTSIHFALESEWGKLLG